MEQGKSVMSPAPEEDEAAEITCDELTVNPIPHHPVPLGRLVEKSRSEVVPRKKGGVEGRCSEIWFYFSLPYSG